MDGEDVKKIKKDDDPFWEPPEDVLIGTANVFLQSLSYALDFDDKLAVTDYKVLLRSLVVVVVLLVVFVVVVVAIVVNVAAVVFNNTCLFLYILQVLSKTLLSVL